MTAQHRPRLDTLTLRPLRQQVPGYMMLFSLRLWHQIRMLPLRQFLEVLGSHIQQINLQAASELIREILQELRQIKNGQLLFLTNQPLLAEGHRS